MTVTVETTGVVTAAGIAASIAAGRAGPQIVVVGYHIGENSAMEGAVASATDTEVDSLVYAGGVKDMSYSQISADTVVWRIRLDSTVGNFDYGNVGLILQDGSLFCKAVMPGRDYKYETEGTSPGNNRYINILLRLANSASLINLSFISTLDCNLPEVIDETHLPPAGTSTFDVYLTDNHTHIGVPVTSARVNDAWWHAPHRLMPGQGQGVMPVGSAAFALNPTASGYQPAPVNGPVAWDPSSNFFVAADGNDPSIPAVGVRTSTFEITTLGVCTQASVGQSGLTDQDFNKFYASVATDPLGPGRMSYNPNGAVIGVLLPDGDVYVDTTGAWRDAGLSAAVADLLALVAYEATQRRLLKKQLTLLMEREFQTEQRLRRANLY